MYERNLSNLTHYNLKKQKYEKVTRNIESKTYARVA